MHIGLIGGIGPAATDYYYRRLIATFARAKVPLDLTIVHADTPTLIANLTTQNKAAQVEIYMRLTARLVAAGANVRRGHVDRRSLLHRTFQGGFAAAGRRHDRRGQARHRAARTEAHRHPGHADRHGVPVLWRRSRGGNHTAHRP